MSCPPLYVVVQGADSRRAATKRKTTYLKRVFDASSAPPVPRWRQEAPLASLYVMKTDGSQWVACLGGGLVLGAPDLSSYHKEEAKTPRPLSTS